jgi:hypothetical protein
MKEYVFEVSENGEPGFKVERDIHKHRGEYCHVLSD